MDDDRIIIGYRVRTLSDADLVQFIHDLAAALEQGAPLSEARFLAGTLQLFRLELQRRQDPDAEPVDEVWAVADDDLIRFLKGVLEKLIPDEG